MLFNSPIFLFAFAPLFFVIYFSLKPSLRNPFIVASSIAFYAWGEPSFIGVVLFSASGDWFIGNALYLANREEKRRWLLVLGICLNIGILAYFKYAGFFVDNLNDLLFNLNLTPFPAMTVALPIGVSFIVFEKITYLVDIYRRLGPPASSITSYLLYVLLFPKLLAGPIVKYHDICNQLRARTPQLEDVTEGLLRFLIGLGKKVLLADTMQEAVDQVFGLSAADLGTLNAWLGTVCFTLQIYFDFTGYSDMAIGLARMMGFRLLENFNRPYIATSITEFWRRWHISLSTWIREYLYIPLGGNRVPAWRMYCNLWLCFVLCGLWHGASWTFVLWGVFHGTLLIVDKIWWLEAQKSLPRLLNVLTTFLLVMFGWVVFRAESFDQALFYFQALLGLTSSEGTFIYLGNNVKAAMAAGLLICFLPATPWLERWKSAVVAWPWKQECQLGLALVLLVISVAKISITTFNPFMYFRF
ncbi:Membrane bound O-acyl transferase MBOAT family protein [Nitrospira japonica]|uniref:Membrane bound O-acyl transferase MBOAT family protein n=1 Tax=Nitrospira japonica TaxID=1325564 RepID=A0A1W1I7X1_9BACT|nr:MBOAT family O-acyltransferase [Nitrospira japonica]SLM49148.1 Membrane bound O-acyl transferase MBOAT family protein [Nitrospira japonica]